MTDLPRPLALPDFPWDHLAPYKQRAMKHPDGICDLSVGTPVDPTPELVRHALNEASDAPGYPTVIGTAEVRDAIRAWGQRRGMVDPGDAGVIPTIGSKEAVAWLPMLLGVRPGDTVLIPEVAYPTYDVGARLAGATPVPVNPADPASWPDASLVWLNTPGNPDGHVLSVDQLRAVVEWARAHGAVVISDECYAALPWVEPYTSTGVPSLLDERVCGGSTQGLIVLYSLSKQSNLAGYRAALMYGDPELLAPVIEVRKHAGMMVPAPVQHAMAVALRDEEHVAQQYARYARRRERLLDAVRAAGLVNDEESAAGLYLWVREAPRDGEENASSWDLVDAFAHLGILVAPGDFYGEAARGYVRIALTASDERIDAAVARLSAVSSLRAVPRSE